MDKGCEQRERKVCESHLRRGRFTKTPTGLQARGPGPVARKVHASTGVGGLGGRAQGAMRRAHTRGSRPVLFKGVLTQTCKETWPVHQQGERGTSTPRWSLARLRGAARGPLWWGGR